MNKFFKQKPAAAEIEALTDNQSTLVCNMIKEQNTLVKTETTFF